MTAGSIAPAAAVDHPAHAVSATNARAPLAQPPPMDPVA